MKVQGDLRETIHVSCGMLAEMAMTIKFSQLIDFDHVMYVCPDVVSFPMPEASGMIAEFAGRRSIFQSRVASSALFQVQGIVSTKFFRV